MLTSTWAVLFGIPVALMGAVFYLVVMVLTGAYITVIARSETTKQSSSETRLPRFARNDESGSSRVARTIRTTLFVLCTLGLLVGICLILVQAFVIHAWCYYCLFSELIDFLLFDAAWWMYNTRQ